MSDYLRSTLICLPESHFSHDNFLSLFEVCFNKNKVDLSVCANSFVSGCLHSFHSCNNLFIVSACCRDHKAVLFSYKNTTNVNRIFVIHKQPCIVSKRLFRKWQHFHGNFFFEKIRLWTVCKVFLIVHSNINTFVLLFNLAVKFNLYLLILIGLYISNVHDKQIFNISNV